MGASAASRRKKRTRRSVARNRFRFLDPRLPHVGRNDARHAEEAFSLKISEHALTPYFSKNPEGKIFQAMRKMMRTVF